MKSEQAESTKIMRKKTNKSLGDEREKTDSEWSKDRKVIEKKASKTIHDSREKADKIRDNRRETMDLDEVEDENIIHELDISEKVQDVERKNEDSALEK